MWFKVSCLLSTLWCLLHPIFWALDSCPEHFITFEDWSFKERRVMGNVSPWARQVCSFRTTDEIWIMKWCWHSVSLWKYGQTLILLHLSKNNWKKINVYFFFFFLIWLVGHTHGLTATFIILFFLSYQYSNIFLSTKGDEIVNSPPCLVLSIKTLM